jgi:hypothetical protein
VDTKTDHESGVRMVGWTLLEDDDLKKVWARIYKDFDFKPSVKIFPSFRTPSPFIKYDISNCYAEELIRDFEDKSVMAFQQCTQPGELIYALDWEHECYLVDPRLEFPRHTPWRVDNGDWIISIHPDGDYHFFVATDFSWGILGHPWEKTITIYGEKFISSLIKHEPLMLHKVLQRG